MRSVEENSPELANEWGPDNGSFTPQNVSYGSNKSIQWIGKCGHTWITSPKARAHGEGCPYCAGKKILTGFNDLKSQYPELAEEWSDKNNYILIWLRQVPQKKFGGNVIYAVMNGGR